MSGSREAVHEAGQSTRGWTVSEEDAGELEYHVVERPALKPRWKPRFRSRSKSARCVTRAGCACASTTAAERSSSPVRARMSRRSALAWALDQREWIDAQLARCARAEPFEAGATIPIEGRDTRIVWTEAEPRTPRLVDGELRCGGPQAGLRARASNRSSRRTRSRSCRPRLREFARWQALRRAGQRRRRRDPLGQLLVRRPHSPKLAADPRTA